MKSAIYKIYYKLGINKRAVIFMVVGVAIIISVKTYARRHFITPAEMDIIRFKTASRDLERYFVRGTPTYDELVTRARNYDEYYINEARKIVDNISFTTEMRDNLISTDERFPHIKYKQLIEHFKDTLSKKLPGVNVYAKFFGIDTLNTSLDVLNKHLNRAWLLMRFVERMTLNGFSNHHLTGISIGDTSSHNSLNDLNVFEVIDIAAIDVQFRLDRDDLLKLFQALRNQGGYFFVEDIRIRASESHEVIQENSLNVSCKLLALVLKVKDSITYSSITPQWKLDADKE